MSGRVIIDLTLLWIYIQRNRHSWGDSRGVEFSGCQSDQSALAHVLEEKGRHSELSEVLKYEGNRLPGDFSKDDVVANFQTFLISDFTQEIILLVASTVECFLGEGVPKDLHALFYSILIATV